LPAGESVVVGSDEIPYKPEALAQKRANYAKRATADPLAKCFMSTLSTTQTKFSGISIRRLISTW
jgi:hypothetical protein